MITGTRPCVATVLIVLSLAVLPASAQSSKSSPAVKELVQALDAAKLDSIAAADPADPGVFVAALYMAGSQLLVVSAKYAAPPLLTAKIKSKEYRDVYIDLSSASVAGSKVFIIDMNCDGLASKPDGDAAPDSWEAGSKQVSFDGEWRKAKLSEEDYTKAFSDADGRYAKIASLLLAQAKQ
jgi:hypothetical protein